MPRRLREILHSNLRHRITFFAAALSISVLVIVGAATLVITYHTVYQAVRGDLATRGRLVAQRLGLSLAALEEDARDLAANSFIANGLVDSTGRDIYLLPFLRDHRTPFGSDVDLILADHQGTPFASSRASIPARPVPRQVRAALQSIHPTALLVQEPHTLSLYLPVPAVFPPTR